MGGQTSRQYGALSDPEKLWKSVWKRIYQPNSSYEQLILLRIRVYAPIDDSVKASDRFEVHKVDEGRLRTLKQQFIENNWEGDRVVLRCRDGTIAPHKTLLRNSWSGFLDGESSFRVDFKEYRLRDISNLIWYIYTNLLPTEQDELLSLLTVAHRLGYRSLAKAGAREIVDLIAELNETNVQSLIEHARRFELKYLYDRLCVVLARNFHRKQLMLSLDSDILRDILSQDCLAVFSEDAVSEFIEEYVKGGHVPLSFARCLRHKFLELPTSDQFALNEIFYDQVNQPRDSFKPYFMRATGKMRYKNSTLTIKIKIELTNPDGSTKKLCAFKQHSNDLQKITRATSFEFPVAIVSCRMNYFIQLGKSVVEINPFSHACYVVCHEVVKLEASESSVEMITKFNQRIVLCEGTATVLKTFCIRSPTDLIEHALAADFDIDSLKENGSGTA